MKNLIKVMTWKDVALIGLTINIILAIVNLIAGNYIASCICSTMAVSISSALSY